MTKLEKLRRELKENSIDAVIILDELNQKYLSDFAFTDGLLLISQARACMITDFRYFEMAEKSASAEFEILMPENRTDFITSFLKETEAKTVGFEGSFVPYAVYNRYKTSYPFVEFVDIKDMIEIVRQVKTEDEISKIQKAQNITDKAFTHLLNVITPNMTEQEVAAELEYAMRREGASAFAFETIAVSGTGSALPHGTPETVKLRTGFLTMDYGAKFDGYCSDMTRTIVIGKADDEIKSLYNTVLKAQTEAIQYLKEGADCGEADRIAREIIDSIPQYKGTFGHSLGHSVGLFIHESPRLARTAGGRKLRKNEILTVEPGIYLYGKYGCRIEDMVAIKENGVYNFTHSTKELIEIL